MLATVFVYAALFAASALGAAVPAPAVDLNDAVAIAERCGINVNGPIPSDATAIDGGFTFKAGSDASTWVRAQLALASSNDIEKRQTAIIGIGMFAGSNCLGEGSWIDNVKYGSQTSRNVEFHSVGISYRAMVSGEHLDFSRAGPTLDLCGQYLYSAAPNTGIGCFNSQPINCFHFWR